MQDSAGTGDGRTGKVSLDLSLVLEVKCLIHSFETPPVLTQQVPWDQCEGWAWLEQCSDGYRRPVALRLDDHQAFMGINHSGVTDSLDNLVTGPWLVQQAVVAREAHVGGGVEVDVFGIRFDVGGDLWQPCRRAVGPRRSHRCLPRASTCC